MHCKHCGAPLEEQQNLCPNCGVTQTEETLNLPVQQQDELYEESLPDGEYDEYEQSEDFEESPAPKKKKNLGLMALILAICVLASAAAILFLNREKAPYAGPLESDQYIVAEFKDHKLTNQTFMYYYWATFYSLYEQYGSYLSQLGLDVNKPFEKQKFGTDGSTWADFFTDYAMKQWANEMAVADALLAEGYTLTEAQQGILEAHLKKVDTDTSSAGYTDKVDYLKNVFDLSADWESYAAYTTTTYTNSAYVSQKYNAFLAEGQTNPGNHKDIYHIDIRHILIKFADSTEASKTAAKTEAEALYNTFLSIAH